ncbi:MAG: hypothetical protein EHM39_07965, partial [Chloroflexi bacterium]
MTTSEERMRILQMIQEGKITAEEAVQLLEALEESNSDIKRRPSQPAAPPGYLSRSGKWLQMRVTDTDTGK